jgi:hypothetical protein
VLAFAELWDRWIDSDNFDEVISATIIVSGANAWMAPYHDRMPVQLEPQDFDAWIDSSRGVDALKPAAEGKTAETPGLAPAQSQGAGDDDPTIIEPVGGGAVWILATMVGRPNRVRVIIRQDRMALVGKVKTALDETRTLILGSQILLGFQCQSAFRESFDQLSAGSRYMSAAALALMLLAICLLVAPSAFHRISQDGQSTGRMHSVTGYFAAAALAPLAIALGLDLTLTLERAWHNQAAGMAAGILFAVMAAAGWYGVGFLMRRTRGAAERGKANVDRRRREQAPLHALIEQMLTEGRVILPGAQALLGFQLVIVLSDSFEKLPASSQLIHGLALLAIALTVVLLITPAALHRIVWAGEESEEVLRIGSRITVLALLPLACGMAADAYVVFARITGATTAAAIAAVLVLLVLLGVWYAWPFVDRFRRQRRASADPEDSDAHRA